MSEDKCKHVIAYGVHDPFSDGYELCCADCGAAIPDPFFLPPTAPLCQTENSTASAGLDSTGNFSEWAAAIDGDGSWLDDQIKQL